MLALLVVGEKAELAGSKTLAITLDQSRSVVHAARTQRPSCQFALARAAEATARATGRVLQWFEQPLSLRESLSASNPSRVRASRRGDGI